MPGPGEYRPELPEESNRTEGLLEKAWMFLDKKLLGATMDAVERGNRLYRKTQKTV